MDYGYCDCLYGVLLWIVLVFKLSNSKIMKAILKATGETVEVNSSGTMSISCGAYCTNDGRTLPATALEFEKVIDWEQRRYELIKELFLKWTGIDDIKREVIIKEHIRICVQTADALLAELKKDKA